ncbi:hypothetical protein SGPA1_30761 [Streptomyces misionensis JCM 4497]
MAIVVTVFSKRMGCRSPTGGGTRCRQGSGGAAGRGGPLTRGALCRGRGLVGLRGGVRLGLRGGLLRGTRPLPRRGLVRALVLAHGLGVLGGLVLRVAALVGPRFEPGGLAQASGRLFRLADDGFGVGPRHLLVHVHAGQVLRCGHAQRTGLGALAEHVGGHLLPHLRHDVRALLAVVVRRGELVPAGDEREPGVAAQDGDLDRGRVRLGQPDLVGVALGVVVDGVLVRDGLPCLDSRAVGDRAEAVDTGLDGPGLLRLVGVVGGLPVGTADHVDLPRERVEAGPHAEVEEQGQLGTRRLGESGADQRQRGHLTCVELHLVGAQHNGALGHGAFGQHLGGGQGRGAGRSVVALLLGWLIHGSFVSKRTGSVGPQGADLERARPLGVALDEKPDVPAAEVVVEAKLVALGRRDIAPAQDLEEHPDADTARAALQVVGSQGLQRAQHPGVELVECLELGLDRRRLAVRLPHGVDDQARYLVLDGCHTHPLMTSFKNVTYLAGRRTDDQPHRLQARLHALSPRSDGGPLGRLLHACLTSLIGRRRGPQGVDGDVGLGVLQDVEREGPFNDQRLAGAHDRDLVAARRDDELHCCLLGELRTPITGITYILLAIRG